MTFSQSAVHGTSTTVRRKTTHRSSTTLRILLNRKSHSWAQLKRNLGKLFFGGA